MSFHVFEKKVSLRPISDRSIRRTDFFFNVRFKRGILLYQNVFFLPHLDALCKPNLMVKTECSGRGRCEDGQCVCNKVPVSYAIISYCLSSFMNYVTNRICLVIIIMLSSNLTGVKNYFIRESLVCFDNCYALKV